MLDPPQGYKLTAMATVAPTSGRPPKLPANASQKAEIDLAALPDPDQEHLAGDLKRIYQRLVPQWLEHMKHLKRDYPYLFSLAARTNPFDASASVEVRAVV